MHSNGYNNNGYHPNPHRRSYPNQPYNNNNNHRGRGYNNNNYGRSYRGNQHQHPSNYPQHSHRSNHRNSQYPQRRPPHQSFHSTPHNPPPRRNNHYTAPHQATHTNVLRSFSANQHNRTKHSDHRTQGSRSRNIRKLKESQSKQKRHDTPPIVTRKNPKQSAKSANILQNALDSLSLESIPFKYDYRSKRNFALLSAKNAHQFAMDPTKVSPWKYSSEIEQKTKVREYMLPCLKLLNNLMALDEAIDFILAPNQKETCLHYKRYRKLDRIKGQKNVCFERIHNLLTSDFYESVDDFAMDVRLIWQNTFLIFGGIEADHEWIRNARFLQRKFEEKMILISRKIPNAKEIFSENGNPPNDPLQMECLKENKNEIDECLKNLSAMKSAISAEMVEENEDDFEEDRSKAVLSNKGEGKSQKKRRRLSTKQRLKTKLDNGNNGNKNDEVEEGEIVRFVPLSRGEMDECDILFEFALRFEAKDVIRRVVMLQNGFDGIEQFEAYRTSIESQGSDLRIDLQQRSAKIQRGIIGILRKGKKEIFAAHKESVYVFKEIANNKKMQKSKQKQIQMHMSKMKEQVKKEQLQKEENEKRMNVDKDSSDDEFDDRLYVETPVEVLANDENIIAKHAETLVVGKDEYQKNEYLPIRPSNIDEKMENSEKWSKFAIDYTNEQNEDEFDF